MIQLIEFILHLDKHIEIFIQNYGALTYLILFLIIFLETGLVVTPFLPGDSLIFAAAAFAALGKLNIIFLFLLLVIAAITGNISNYYIGKTFGHKISKSRFIKKEHMDRTEEFFEKYGNKAIIISRFMPIIRTFVPFVAGIGQMKYSNFLPYNIIGGSLWVAIFCMLGYFFGNIPFVKSNFSIVTIAIILISVIPAVVAFLKERKSKVSKAN